MYRPAEYLKEQLVKLMDEALAEQKWFDITQTWVMLLSLRSTVL